MKAAIQMIREADRGQIMTDLQQGLDDIVEAIEAARGDGKGKLTLTFEVSSPSPGAFEIKSKLDVKIPAPQRLPTTMFLGEGGELSRHDPRQPVMPAVVDADFRNRRASAGDDE